MVDIIRIDHFIGYAKYFRIPITDKVANNGKWLNAPGEKLFNALESSINNFDIFVEDLGDISESVINLRKKYNYAGMNVLQFDLNNLAEHKKIIKNSILYTGTHDNDTLLGWYKSYSNKSDLLDYFKSNEKNIVWDIIKYAFNTESKMVIIPFQDLIGLDNSARFNIPGTLSKNNWSWRMNKEYINERVIDKLFKISNESNRNN
jgi:4-alpha-glucanotransferase